MRVTSAGAGRERAGVEPGGGRCCSQVCVGSSADASRPWGERPSREVARRRRCRRRRCGLHSGQWALGDRGGTVSLGSWEPGSPGRWSVWPFRSPLSFFLFLSEGRFQGEGGETPSLLEAPVRTEVPEGHRPPATGGRSRVRRLLAARRPSASPAPRRARCFGSSGPAPRFLSHPQDSRPSYPEACSACPGRWGRPAVCR